MPLLATQKNAYDCGLFLLEFAEIFLENPDFLL
jgi:Ulp1 family protease